MASLRIPFPASWASDASSEDPRLIQIHGRHPVARPLLPSCAAPFAAAAMPTTRLTASSSSRCHCDFAMTRINATRGRAVCRLLGTATQGHGLPVSRYKM